MFVFGILQLFFLLFVVCNALIVFLLVCVVRRWSRVVCCLLFVACCS